MRDTKYLRGHTDKQLARARRDAERCLTDGTLIGRVDSVLEVLKDIKAEELRRLNLNEKKIRKRLASNL